MLDWISVSARLVQYAGALVLFGFSAFYFYGYRFDPRSAFTTPPKWARSGVLIPAVAALAGALLWVGTQATIFFPDDGFFSLEANWIVLAETGFGRAMLLREALLLAFIVSVFALPQSRPVWAVQTVLGALIVGSFAWVGHGTYDSGFAGVIHLGADFLHLLTAGLWIGALVPLCILIARSLQSQTEDDAHACLYALERFSGIGPTIVSVLLATGIINGWFLVGISRWQSLFTTDYGIALSVKVILFFAMLGLAAANRYYLTPHLKASLANGFSPVTALHKLRSSLAAELGLSAMVLTAVALFGTWEPPIAN